MATNETNETPLTMLAESAWRLDQAIALLTTLRSALPELGRVISIAITHIEIAITHIEAGRLRVEQASKEVETTSLDAHHPE
jgi:hypothetical protein